MKIKVVVRGGSMDGTYEFPDGYRRSFGAAATPEELAWTYASDCKTLSIGWSIVGPSLRALEDQENATDCYCLVGRQVVEGVLTYTLAHNADRAVSV
ncbi:MAG: hypothetical protein U0836_04695 [Pirellulales bacterium]